jgi:hypothetical protein
VPDAVSNFSAFTLGSSSTSNILPITLISFEVNICQNSVCLKWQTASEINNDFFTIEKSAQGIIWEDFERVNGAGNSDVLLNYETIDRQPHTGLSYYRLKQTDFDGTFKYSSVKAVYLDKSNQNGLTIYPNPAIDHITIKGLPSDINLLMIYNMLGQDLTPSTSVILNTESKVLLDISLLLPGVYQVRILNMHSSFIKH